MLAGIILVFTVWVIAWQLMRARDRRLDAESRLAARRRVRARASRLVAGSNDAPSDHGSREG